MGRHDCLFETGRAEDLIRLWPGGLAQRSGRWHCIAVFWQERGKAFDPGRGRKEKIPDFPQNSGSWPWQRFWVAGRSGNAPIRAMGAGSIRLPAMPRANFRGATPNYPLLSGNSARPEVELGGQGQPLRFGQIMEHPFLKPWAARADAGYQTRTGSVQASAGCRPCQRHFGAGNPGLVFRVNSVDGPNGCQSPRTANRWSWFPLHGGQRDAA